VYMSQSERRDPGLTVGENPILYPKGSVNYVRWSVTRQEMVLAVWA
jgi:hypothetical protein